LYNIKSLLKIDVKAKTMRKVATSIFVYLVTFILQLNAQTRDQTTSECNEVINLSKYKQLLPEEMKGMLPPEPFTVPVKRIHSRHRRFLAPGAAWQIKVGVRVTSIDWEAEFNHRINYNFDYLFGGSIAFAAMLVAKNASAITEQTTFTQVRDQLTLLSQLAASTREAAAARAVSNRDKNKNEKKKKGRKDEKSEEKDQGKDGSYRSERFVESNFIKIMRVTGLISLLLLLMLH